MSSNWNGISAGRQEAEHDLPAEVCPSEGRLTYHSQGPKDGLD